MLTFTYIAPQTAYAISYVGSHRQAGVQPSRSQNLRSRTLACSYTDVRSLSLLF